MVNRLGAGAAFGAKTLLKKEAAVWTRFSRLLLAFGPAGEDRLGDDSGTDEAARPCLGRVWFAKTETSVEILSPEKLFVEILQEEGSQTVSAGRDTRRLCGLAGLHGGGEVGKENIRFLPPWTVRLKPFCYQTPLPCMMALIKLLMSNFAVHKKPKREGARSHVLQT